MEPGKGVLFDHRHRQNEEAYVVIREKEIFIIDGEVIQVKEGSIIRISPSEKRRWENNSDKELIVMVIQAADKSLNIIFFPPAKCNYYFIKV